MGGRIVILSSGAGVCPGIFACNLLSAVSEVSLIAKDAPFEKEMVAEIFSSAGFYSDGFCRKGEESEIFERRKYRLPGL